MNTCLIKESHRGYEAIRLSDELYNNNRVIFFNEEVNSSSAEQLILQLLTLENQKPGEPILLYINSNGGSTVAGLAIIDFLLSIKSPVYTACLGSAYSMAAVILAAGEKGHRTVSPHSSVMIHEPLIAGGMGGSATSIQRTAESILETKRTINELLAKFTGKSLEEIDEATSFDNMMNAEQAVNLGLVDEISVGLEFIRENNKRKELTEL